MPAMLLNSSAAKCVALPTPPDENSSSPGLRLRHGDQLLDGFDAELRIDDQHRRHADGGGDAGEILHVVERRGRNCRQDDVRRRHREQRVAVGRGPRHALSRNRAARAGPIFRDHRLFQGRGEFLADDAGRQIDSASRREADHHANGLVGIFRGVVSGTGPDRRQREQRQGNGSDRIRKRMKVGHAPLYGTNVSLRQPAFAAECVGLVSKCAVQSG